MASSYEREFQNFERDLRQMAQETNKALDELSKKTKSYASSWSELGKKIVSSIDPVAISQKNIAELEARMLDKQNLKLKLTQAISSLEQQRYKIAGDGARQTALEAEKRAAISRGLAGLSAAEERELQKLQQEFLIREEILADINRQLPLMERARLNAERTEKSLKGQIESQQRNAAILAFVKDTFSQIYQMASDYDKFLSDQAKTLGLSKDTIDAQYRSVQKITKELNANLASNRQIVEAQTKLVQSYAITGKAAEAVAQSIAQTAKSTGLTVDEASKLQETLAEIGGTSLQAQNNMAGFAIQVAKAYGVPLNVLLKDVLNSSTSVRLIFKGNTEELIKQAAEARKLGTSLDAAAKSAEVLLNFESSIGAELKASALLGQGLNFNESRRLAFAGDLIGAEKALQRELEKVGDLDKLNYNQRKALAEATGKDFAELQKIQTQKKNQLEIEKRFPEEAAKLRKLQEDLNTLQKKGKQDRDAEYKKMLEQQMVEAESALLNQQKAAAMDRIGQVLKPIYEFVNRIQAAFYGWVSGLHEGWIWAGLILTTITGLVVAVGTLVGSFNLLSTFAGKAAASLGRGIGSGLIGISRGVTALGTALQTFPVGKLAGIAASIAIASLAAIGFAKAFQMMREVTVGDVALLVGSLIVLGAGLAFVGTLLTGPQILGVLAFAAALAVMGVAAMEVGFAFKMAAPAIESIGKTISTLATVVGGVIIKAFDTMLGIFTALPEVMMSVAVGLSQIANIGFFKLSAAAAGVAAVSAAIFDLGKTLNVFPTSQLTSITAQIDMLSDSAQGLQVAVDSLKELSSVKLPKLEFGGLATLGILNATAKKEQTDEVKAGMQVLADKFDALIGMMANGGIAVNLDGTRVNHALDTAKSRRGSYGQATIA
jgi:hypothetical protein